MGNPVVHFEIMGKDADQLRSYYHELFGWDFNADNPQNYGLVRREENLMPDGVGIGGGNGSAPNYDGHVTFYVGRERRGGGAGQGGEPRRVADDGPGDGDGGGRRGHHRVDARSRGPHRRSRDLIGL
jgi:hypothetical protein